MRVLKIGFIQPTDTKGYIGIPHKKGPISFHSVSSSLPQRHFGIWHFRARKIAQKHSSTSAPEQFFLRFLEMLHRTETEVTSRWSRSQFVSHRSNPFFLVRISVNDKFPLFLTDYISPCKLVERLIEKSCC